MNFLSLHTHVGPILGSQIVAPSPDFGSARLLFTQLALLPQMVREPLPQPAINHYQSNLKTSLDDSSRVPIPTNDLPFSQDDLLSCRSLHLHRVDSSHGSPCLLFLLPQSSTQCWHLIKLWIHTQLPWSCFGIGWLLLWSTFPILNLLMLNKI